MSIEKRVRRYRFKNAKGRVIQFTGMLIAEATDDVRVSQHREIRLYRKNKDNYCVSISYFDAEVPRERTVRVIDLDGLREMDLPAAIAAVRPAFVRKKLQADLGLTDDAYPTCDVLRVALQ
jgi:hypothetical protein